MKVSGQVAMRGRRRRGSGWGGSHLPLLGVATLILILGLLLFAGTAVAASSGLGGYSGVPEGAEAQSPVSAAYESILSGRVQAAGPQSLAAPAAAAAGTRYEQNDPRAVYSGTWATYAQSAASGGTYARSSAPGASVAVTFTGAWFCWIATKGPTQGTADIYVDGHLEETVDLYAPAVSYQVRVWDTSVLALSTHTVTIVRSTASPTGSFINIDAFEVADVAYTGYVTGKVTNSAGTGLANVYVLAWDEEFNLLRSGLTSAGGTYTITSLPNERVLLCTVNNGNYIDEWYNNVRLPGNWDAVGATRLDLGATPTRSGINFSLATGKSISGNLTTSNGTPLVDQEVDVYNPSGVFMLGAVTDGTGSYSARGLPAGKYYVRTVNDVNCVDEWYSNDPVITDPTAASATVINISTSNATNKNFVLATGMSIYGWVRDTLDWGPGVSGAYVCIQPASRNGWSSWAKTYSDGTYTVEGLLPGEYVAFTANDQGFVDEWYYDIPVPSDLAGDTARIIVTDGAVEIVTFTLAKGYTISGNVIDNGTGEALSDEAVVEVYDSEGELCAAADVGGAYDLSYVTWALPAGTYYVRSSDIYAAGYIDEWYNDKQCGVYERTGADPVLLGTADATGVDFGLSRMTRYEQTDPHIYYTPAWTRYSTSAASGGSYSYSAATNAVATIYFNGTRLDVAAMMGTSTGKADLWVDNVKIETVDLSATAAHYDVKVFTTGVLPNGPHKVEIKYNPGNVSGKRITLDAVEVAGTLTYAVPMITAVTPDTGFTLGGDSVTITGANLAGATSVTFGGTPAAGIISNSATQIVAVAPAHGAGSVQVQVTTPAGSTVDVVSDDFTFVEPGVPTITSLSPSTGSIDGGTSVTISGTEFAGLSGPSAVTFDGLDAESYTRVSATTITAVAPQHAAGTVRVQVTAAGGTTADTDKDDFTYTETPPVTRYDQFSNANIMRTGTWADYASAGSWGGSYGRSSTSSASAMLWFTGTQIAYVAFKGTTTGYADVYIDNVKQATVNLTATAVAYQQVVWTSPVLTNALHSFKVVRNNTLSGTKYVTLDAVDITGSISAPPTRFEQGSVGIHKVGTWADFSNATASGSSYGRSLTADASATIHFTGSRIDYIGFKGTTTGWVEVWLDDELKATIDLAATTAAGNQLIWSSASIENEAHTLVLKRSGTSLAAEYLTLDAVDIWGAIAP